MKRAKFTYVNNDEDREGTIFSMVVGEDFYAIKVYSDDTVAYQKNGFNAQRSSNLMIFEQIEDYYGLRIAYSRLVNPQEVFPS